MKSSPGILVVALALLIEGGPGCGGNVVDQGSGGSSSGTTGSPASNSASTGAGGVACAAHTDCPGEQLCLFSAGVCAWACNAMVFEPCPAGLVCDPCAASSCPGCKDCVGACVTATDDACDDHDDCTLGELCVYSLGVCRPSCSSEDLVCADTTQTCDLCATSSCPGCENCAGACL